MPKLTSKYFGQLEYQELSVFDFPAGVPGFEQERQFLLLEQHENRPLVFVQSLSRPDLCFLAMPALSLNPAYRLNLDPEDLRTLELAAGEQPRIGNDLLCLTLVSVEENQAPTANLLAPLVVNLRNRRGVQAIQHDSSYSHQHSLAAAAAGAPC